MTYVQLAEGAGLAAGRNAIAQHSTTEFVMILDDDVRFHDATTADTRLDYTTYACE